MKFIKIIFAVFLTTKGFALDLKERDLSIVLDASLKPKIKMESPFFQDLWFKEIAYGKLRESDVAEAYISESPQSDWQLISVRIAPCVPIVSSHAFNPETFCWPQVRTVWGPVIEKFRATWGNVQDYSDDRAIHGLYWVDPSFLFPNLGEKTSIFKKILNINKTKPSNLKSLDANLKKDWLDMRSQTLNLFLEDVLNLRDKNIPPQSYEGFGLRPELYNAKSNKSFSSRFSDFLKKYTPKTLLTELTTFSLPEGRDPAGIDMWLFAAFDGINGQIKQKKLSVHDRYTGKVIDAGTFIQSVTMTTDDPSFYKNSNPQIRNQIFLYPKDQSKIKNLLFSEKALLVGETSCSTCHKFNDLKFNFHNFSKFEDRPTTISKLLKNEVKKDLNWLILLK